MLDGMIDVHIHVVPPNLPGTGALAPLLNLPPEVVAAELRAQMQTAGVTDAFAMKMSLALTIKILLAQVRMPTLQDYGQESQFIFFAQRRHNGMILHGSYRSTITRIGFE